MIQNKLPIGAALPAFGKLPAVDGATYSADDFADAKVLVVVFSCNHCPYVQGSEGRIMEFQAEYAGKGVRLVAINSNDIRNYPDDDFAGMVKRAGEKKFNFVYLRDEVQAVAEAFGATHTPEFFVFDSRRKLRYHGKMDDSPKNPDAVQRRHLREAVDAILAGKPVPEPETHSIGCTIKWKV
jgi:thiol-disulfide isomerase/thioredoxin